MSNISRICRIATALAAVIAICSNSRAEDHSAIGPFISEDVVAVGYVNLEKISVPAVLEELERLKLIPENEVAAARQEAQAIQGVFSQLPAHGARRIYALVRPQDVFQGGPAWIVQTENPEQTAAVIEWLKPMLEQGKQSGDVANFLPDEFSSQGSLVIAGRANRMKELTAAPSGAVRADAVAALAALNADAGLVHFGSRDTSRVLREMFPQLPAPFMEIDGKLLADGMKWSAINVKLPPQPTISVSVEATAPEIAATLRMAFEKAAELAKGFLMMEMVNGPPAHQERARQLLPLMPLLQPAADGNRITFTFGDDEQEIAFVADLLPAITQEMREDAYRSQRMNQFKQIALGMLNYESAKGLLPTVASFDQAGRPLLSWRVQILPYMEHSALYQKFKLDEPWDSEHNRKLISEMPECYREPDPAIRAAIGEDGRTTYVVPRGEGLLFEGAEGLKFNSIKDGSSNTVLALEAVPERAVVWTKPDDWDVELNDPLCGVKRSDRPGFTAAFADGHVVIISNDVDAVKFKAQLTPSGGEATPN